ncbi:hypothetical protein RHSIM_Rhsim05G0231300 [Rhododendron simsii]|uniref:DUF599 domain-containing protein n=1 Tax=Rhododendron simsii TaxID=118357 RepID=A0A834LR02_RHOSS|nr:hypothetical protein RHSIM_Rhsim05G0231300 [Rhododendron simsii]
MPLIDRKMGVILYLDTILVPLSLFLTIGYHAFLWHSYKNKPFLTTIGMHMLRRRSWIQDMQQARPSSIYRFLAGDDKKGMLAVQSLRNTLMGTILTASISVIINIALACLTNNTYYASRLLNNRIFGSRTDMILVLKYGSASLFLLVSFLCSSMAVGCLIDANFLINAMSSGEDHDQIYTNAYTQRIMERGFLLAVVGERVLCVTFSLLFWMLGPVPVALSSVALVWGLYVLDFAGKLHQNCNKQGKS